MEEKKVTKIRLSTAILGFIIIILIFALAITYYFGFVKKDENTETKQNNLENTTENITRDNSVSNKITEEIKQPEVKEQELDLNSTEVKGIVDKFSFGFLSHSIYKVGDFDSSNVPNDLVLRLGWMKLKNADKTLDEYTLKETVSKENMEKTIKSIFGNNIKYQDKSFRYRDVEIFSQYAAEDVYYNTNTNEYTSTLFQGGGAPIPFIYEEVQKATKQDDTIKLYVKTAFVNIERAKTENNSIVDFIDDIYTDYNFNREEFENKILSVSEEEFYTGYEVGQQLATKPNKSLSNVLDKLNTYVYTFSLDKYSGEYYFSSFAKE